MKEDFYRPSGNVKDSSRTYVPDLYRQVAAEMQTEDSGATSAGCSHIVKLQHRPLIGVLYSISAGIDGELFPVNVGRNIIGSDPSCDICLRETSISSFHGLLLARKQVNDEGEEYINVLLSDSNSSNGTSVNGERLSFEKVACSDGDILTIGQNYVLVLSLFNAINKLSVSYDFDRIQESQKVEEESLSMDQSRVAIIGGTSSNEIENHSDNITSDVPDSSMEFYRPTKQQGQDHYNNKTVII